MSAKEDVLDVVRGMREGATWDEILQHLADAKARNDDRQRCNSPGETALSLQEIGRRGEEIYHRIVRPALNESYRGKVVVIDIDSGDYAIGKNSVEANEELRGRRPLAETWCHRIGFRTLHWFGGQAEQEPI